jgi:hypothetical protein
MGLLNRQSEPWIQTMTTWARAMMLHYIIDWPAEARADLWPMACNLFMEQYAPTEHKNGTY